MLYVTVRPRTKRRVVLLSSLALLLLVIHWGSPTVSEGHVPVATGYAAVDRVEGTSRDVALTFNTAWGTKTFTAVCEVLQEKGVQGTFFVAGPWAEANPELVDQAAAAGHEVGSLGYRQIDLTSTEDQVIGEEMDRAIEALAAVLEERPQLFRPPGGRCNERVTGVAMEKGLVVVTAALDAQDWANPGVEKIVERVREGVNPGFIIEFHADDSSAQLSEALPVIIQMLHEDDYRLVTVSQLLGEEGGG